MVLMSVEIAPTTTIVFWGCEYLITRSPSNFNLAHCLLTILKLPVDVDRAKSDSRLPKGYPRGSGRLGCGFGGWLLGLNLKQATGITGSTGVIKSIGEAGSNTPPPLNRKEKAIR